MHVLAILVMIVVGVLLLVFGASILQAMASPNPAETMTVQLSAMRCFALALVARGARRAAILFGAWRYRKPYTGCMMPVYAPSWLGRRLVLLQVAAVERALGEPAYRLVRSTADRKSDAADVARARACMQGARWCDANVHRLCPPSAVKADLVVAQAVSNEHGQRGGKPPIMAQTVLHVFDQEQIQTILSWAKELAQEHGARADALRRVSKNVSARERAVLFGLQEDQIESIWQDRIGAVERERDWWERLVEGISKAAEPLPGRLTRQDAEGTFDAEADGTGAVTMAESFAARVFENLRHAEVKDDRDGDGDPADDQEPDFHTVTVAADHYDELKAALSLKKRAVSSLRVLLVSRKTPDHVKKELAVCLLDLARSEELAEREDQREREAARDERDRGTR